MKKLLLPVLAGALATGLVGCGGDKAPARQVNLTYATWGNLELEQAMLDAFMEEYPHIGVKLDTTITGHGAEFTENLVNAALGGVLPDVFATDHVPTVIDNGLVYDIQEFWETCPDAARVFDNIQPAALYGNERYAAPSYQFAKGMYVNKTLLEDLGQEIPDYNWTFDEFIALAEAVTGETNSNGRKSHGIGGYFGVLGFESVMPAQDDPTLGYSAYNGTDFNFNHDLWVKYLGISEDLAQRKVLESMTGEEKSDTYGDANAWPFAMGDVAFAIDGSWNVVNHNMMFEGTGFDVELYPFPAGKNHAIPSILDFMCLSYQTAYPEESYELLKFMSFGEKGWQARLRIMEEMDLPITMFPVADYEGVWDTIYDNIYDMGEAYDGLLETAKLMHNSVIDTEKWVPGYDVFWANLYLDGDIYDSMTPVQKAAAWAPKIKETIDEAYEELGLSK